MSNQITFTIEGEPVGKPRQTQRDKWMKRDCVMRYRAWADLARLSAPTETPQEPLSVVVWAYIGIPASHSKKRRAELKGQSHRQKPDADNILKAVCDALFKRDEVISLKHIEKFWDDGNGPRVEVQVTG
jgi:Holliday junction resolvase RusA-like endonuclease